MFSRRARIWLWTLALCQAALLLTLASLRYLNVHQRTFDLALYARIAWGLAHGNLWAPIAGTDAWGCHIALVLWPLGLLGRVFGTAPVLLLAQSLAIGLTVFPLARVGARRLGTRGIWLASAAFVLYPNLFHVGTYEFHPGTLAILPMAWGFDALDRANMHQLAWSALAVLACREDLGAFCLLLALVYYYDQRDRRALLLAACVGVYTALALAVVVTHAPKNSSLSQHYAQWGGSPLGVFRVLLHDPQRVVAHMRAHLHYLPQVLMPLSFFSLRAPRLLLPALPYLLLNLLSEFPTADKQFSHYLTPAVPSLIVSGVVGVTAVHKVFLQRLWYVTLAFAHVVLGGSPASLDFDRSAFTSDRATASAKKILQRIPANASVQAPDPLLAHLAERNDVRRAPPPESGADFTVLDVSHRDRYAQQEVLLRTSEEPLIRSWLARTDRALVAYEPPYALFQKGASPREGVAKRCLVAGAPASDQVLDSCLAFTDAQLQGATLTLALSVRSPCPRDLAVRFGAEPTAKRVELLCGGTISPSLLQPGDLVRSDYTLRAEEAAAIRRQGLWVGTLTSTGPAGATDTLATRVALREE